MKKINIIYWIFTALLIILMGFWAVNSFFMTQQGIELMRHLGYAPYVLTLLSVTKLLGIVALLIPGFRLIKEWAYAGFTIDLFGAVFSFIAVGDPVSAWAPLILGFVFIAVSYIYWHKKLALAS
jgi:hypothetical protein